MIRLVRSWSNLFVLALLFWPLLACLATDHSGVSPQAISLPTGPGSMEGLGEKFQPQINSGTFNYQIPLKLPPVRGGSPSLSLQYNPGNENGMLGLGWALKLPCTRRQTDKGLPQYISSDLFCDENGEELVHLADGSYRQKVESLFIRYQMTTNGGWLGNLLNGSVMTFGSSTQSRLDSAGQATFRWMVDSFGDPNGNLVRYFYFQDSQQIYPAEIRYGIHITQPSGYFSIQFGYSTNRADPFVDCRPRFACTNRLLLQNITLFYGTRRIREWQFKYATNSFVSLLVSVTQFGDERSVTDANAQLNVDYLPPTQFGYTPFAISTQPTVHTISFDSLEQNFSFDNEGSGGRAEFVDINHDGLPDILINSDNVWRSIINPGPQATNWPASQLITNPPPVTGISLGQPGVRLVDLNGDGHAKLAIAQDLSNTAFQYYDFVSPTTLGPATNYQTLNGISLSDPQVQFVDLDDDKAMDVVRLDPGSGSLEALYTRNFLGQPNAYGVTNMPMGVQFDFTQGWQLADINGDRLQDMVWLIDADNTEVSLNLGWGKFAPPYIMSGGPGQLEMHDPGTSGPRLVDINQDGLADLVIVENGEVKVWLNQNGTNWSGPLVIQNTPAYQAGQTAVRFADINGNGSVDIIWHQNQDPFISFVDLFPNGKAYLLNHASTTLGRTLDIAYANSTDFLVQDAATSNQWTSLAPFSVPLMSQIVEGDGLGNVYTNQFSYRNDYYDAVEHQFRGFEQAVQTELGNDSQGAPTLLTLFQFDVGRANESLKGKTLRIEADTAGGQPFYRQTNFWTPRLLNLPAALGESRPVTFAFQNDTFTEEIELGPETNAVTLEETFNYDDYGNQVFHADYGRVENGNRGAWNDERIIFRQFSAEYPNGTNLWLLNRLVEEDVADINTNIVARKQVFYDDPAFSGNNLGTITRGNPTLVRDWINISNNAYRSTTRKEYDAFGNVTGVYDPLGAPGQPSLGHYRQIAFDNQIHSHPVTETIYTANTDAVAAGSSQPSLVMRANYDIGLGVMTSAVDFNQNTSYFNFDTFGRIVSITKPYDTTNLPTAAFSYLLQSLVASGQTINYIETDLREVAGQSGTFSSRTFFDGMGRKLMTRTQSETNGVVVVNDATLFNRRRSVWRSFLPYFEAGTLSFNSINRTGAYVETDYDALGRQTVKSQPPTPPETYRAFSFTKYSPLTRLVLDEEQTQTDSPHYGAAMLYLEDGLRNQNGQGRLRQVQELVKLSDTGQTTSSPNAWLTQYNYDTLDNFLGYTDSQGNQKFFQYDALSRKTFMNDPDRGVMRWNYDLASNVTNTFDAKAQQIVYAYDGANRLLTENYRDGDPLPPWRSGSPLSGGEGSGVRASVVYHYDLPLANTDNGDGTSSTASNTLGKLAWVEDLSGEEHTSYDARGRVAYTIKRLPDLQFLYATNVGLNQPLVSYRTGFAYDSLDRMVSLTYPDNDSITYTYNNRNLLLSIQGGVNGLTRAGGIIENIGYEASAQLGSIGYGNGILTQYGYDPRLRLASITTAPATNASAPLIAFSYSFDDASNIKTIYDNRPTSVVPVGNPRRNTQVFSYDDLYRITYAGYAFGTPGDTTITGGSIAYNYDRIGNMLGQISTISDSDPLTGLPVANLGRMSSGGSAATANRIGRAPGDPPGPHALTQIQSTNAQLRVYPYDANGNMTVIDGLTNTWDFKDRLVGVQNSQMSAQYLYDYTDRRVAKNVAYAPGSTNSGLTTLYINKFFEVRENDQPTKFVWNGDTRVARVIGSLSNNQRIQRIRLWPGMNLVSLAVNGASLPGNTNFVAAAYLWNPASLSWQFVSTGSSLAAGSVLWLQVNTNGTIPLAGTYTDPLPYSVSNGLSFLPSTGLEAWDFKSAISNLPSATVWAFDENLAARLLYWLPPPLERPSIPATSIGPGKALYIRSRTLAAIDEPDPNLRIHFYHEDHLGSSSCLTDAGGKLIGEAALYAFGNRRSEVRLRGGHENYVFTQKERDSETELNYFEARFHHTGLSRFIRPDPLSCKIEDDQLKMPLSFNSYAYCRNNPLAIVDPTGLSDWNEVKQGMYTWGVGAVQFQASALETAAGVTEAAATSGSIVGAVPGAVLAVHGVLGLAGTAVKAGTGFMEVFHGFFVARDRRDGDAFMKEMKEMQEVVDRYTLNTAFWAGKAAEKFGETIQVSSEGSKTAGTTTKFAVEALKAGHNAIDLFDAEKNYVEDMKDIANPSGGQTLKLEGIEVNGTGSGQGYFHDRDTGEVTHFGDEP